MKSLTQHIKEKLHIGKDYMPDIEFMVNDAVDNHITKVPDKFNITNNTFHKGWKEMYQFYSAEDFIAVFDELDIPYDIEENKNVPSFAGNGNQYWIILKLNDTYKFHNSYFHDWKDIKYDKIFIKNYHMNGVDGCWVIELYDIKNTIKYAIQGQINDIRAPKNPNIKNYEEQLTLHYYSGFSKKEIDKVIKPFFIELLEQIKGDNS